MLEALVAAAAELLIAAELPVEDPVAGLSAPGLVVVSPDGHGVGTAVEEPLDAVGQLARSVFSSAMWWAVWVCSSWLAMMARTSWRPRGHCRAGHVHTGGGLSVLVVAIPGEPLIQVGVLDSRPRVTA